jgi:hypothetical protein
MEFVIAIAAAALFALGIVLGNVFKGPFAPSTPIDTGSSDCDALCNQIGTKAMERRAAEAVENSARAGMVAAIASSAAAALIATACWVAVGVAAASFFGLVAVPALTIAAIAATAAALVASGIAAAAIVDVSNKASAAAAARAAEAQARDLFLTKCKNAEKVSACLSRSLPG